jgi:uncharacterized membrane protein YecN with MAPEG domain
MEYPTLVVLLALLQYVWFSMRVGMARGKYNVEGPSCAGNEVFERVFRVQQNTLEQLIIFVPASFAFAQFVSPVWAPMLGWVFILGRFVYAAEYVKEPKTRTLGFALTFLPRTMSVFGLTKFHNKKRAGCGTRPLLRLNVTITRLPTPRRRVCSRSRGHARHHHR